MKTIKILIITSILLFINTQTILAQCHIDDWNALKALYESADGDNWKNNNGWEEVKGNTPTANCNLGILAGVGLDEQGQIDSLNLPYNQLNGSLSAELDNLTNLKWFNLQRNQLSGNLPVELGNLTNLIVLDLYFNDFTGSLPAELGNLTNLKYLDLSDNQFNGNLPSELGNLINLENLNLWSNNLSGSLPSELGNLINLRELYLSNNELSGSLPAELGNLTKLEDLSLRYNELSGSLPAELGNLTNLTGLYLYHNEFSGSLPAELGNLTNLRHLWLDDNQLGGCFDMNLQVLCDQLWIARISSGNDFDASWVDFCDSGVGTCITYVYPGDLNHDGIVDNTDFALKGIYTGQPGIARTEQGTNWQAYPSEDWDIEALDHTDLKHHDCNGDGIIDDSDYEAVDQNWEMEWEETITTPPPPESDFQLRFYPIEELNPEYLRMNVALENITGGDLELDRAYFTIKYDDLANNVNSAIFSFLTFS